MLLIDYNPSGATWIVIDQTILRVILDNTILRLIQTNSMLQVIPNDTLLRESLSRQTGSDLSDG